jgi:uncharacterized membrane protein
MKTGLKVYYFFNYRKVIWRETPFIVIVALLSQSPVPKSSTATQGLFTVLFTRTVLILPFTIQRQLNLLINGSVVPDSQATSKAPLFTRPFAVPSVLNISSNGTKGVPNPSI